MAELPCAPTGTLTLFETDTFVTEITHTTFSVTVVEVPPIITTVTSLFCQNTFIPRGVGRRQELDCLPHEGTATVTETITIPGA
jgi:hypothetical protein